MMTSHCCAVGDAVVAQGVAVVLCGAEAEAVLAGVEVEAVEERIELKSQLSNLTRNWRPIMRRL
jgi:hypothetical protein